jgi:hypothetical protein
MERTTTKAKIKSRTKYYRITKRSYLYNFMAYIVILQIGFVFLAYFPKMKVGLSNQQSVCV